MKAYFYDFGICNVAVEVIADRIRFEKERVCGVVVAPTRGKANALALAHEKRDTHVEWTDLKHLRVVAQDATGTPRVVLPGDPESGRLWAMVDSMDRVTDLQAEE